MFAFKLNHVLFIFILNGCECQRRIKDGEIVGANKKYMVYLLKASVSPQYYEGWLCGGALVSPEFIVTSAACVTDVTHLYAIAGYNKYIRDTEINNDPCTKEKKKKIILTCTPKAYELKYEQVEKWSYIDIAVVKVESPYDFADTSFEAICSYTPVAIQINYEMKYQEPGVDAIVFGWGHHDKWREQMDPTDFNQENLNYAPTLIQNKEACKKEYAVYNGMDEIIDRYMICTMDKGNINDEGETILKSAPTAQGCTYQRRVKLGYEGVSCESANAAGDEIVLIDNTRKDNNPTNGTRYIKDQKRNYLNNELNSNVVDYNTTQNYSSTSLFYKMYKALSTRRLETRRNGICQNDHGGPLVTWVGSHEVLIGVASAFKITEELECIGPYLFTSTQCNGAFLDCILRSDPSQTETTRRQICQNPEEKGFKLVENHISWQHHPDGPADNEKNISSTINKTLNLMDSKKETNEIHYNTTKLDNTNITNSNTTNLIHIPTRTTTVKYVDNITPTKLTNVTSAINTTFTNLTHTTSTNNTTLTNLANATSTINTTLTNLTNIKSMDLKNSAATFVVRATSTILVNSTSTNLNNALSMNIANASSTNEITVLSTNSINATSTNLTNATFIDLENKITSILINTTTTKRPQRLLSS